MKKSYNIFVFIISTAVLLGITAYWYQTAIPCSSAPSIKCGVDGFEQQFHPFLWAFSPVLLVSFLLFFVRREVFTAWAKFAIIGFPVMLGGLLYAFNIEQSTGSWIGGPTEAQIASILLPGLFLLISIIIIITKSIKLRRT